MLDILGPAVNGDTREPNDVVKTTRVAVQEILRMEKKLENKTERIYQTYDEALARLLEAAKAGNGAIPVESAKIILKRGMQKVGSGYKFTRDPRFLLWANQAQLYGMPRRFQLEFAQNIKVPQLIIKVNSYFKNRSRPFYRNLRYLFQVNRMTS